MTRDKADDKLIELKCRAHDLIGSFQVYKPMHLHLHDRVRDFLVLTPPKRAPKWVVNALREYMNGMVHMLERDMLFAYEFKDGGMSIVQSEEYKHTSPHWINENWVACGMVWPKPDHLGNFKWYSYTTREEHEARTERVAKRFRAKERVYE